ncbi:tetratricopeptide repeat protein [Asticcacaulis sp. AC402]|uniref:tetratricopeptide repeat protein n=1 Tax=Asticcacaulis sp. AC402 TaxID=1282361 RepID=UPI0003C4021C|nr:tetratricopeptide repeat protein [Asticcacaulis sp. AC402]ESQ75216.1 hypothetical protein ABAC402_11140 [Asticcacaulis sp. AC402]
MKIRILLWGLALAVTAPAALAQESYDGTGSLYTGPQDPSIDKAAIAKSEKEKDEAEKKLRKRAGYVPRAMVDYARSLEQPLDGRQPDMAQAYDLYERAAEGNETYGWERMCLAYILGQGRQVDLNKGFTYCGKLALDNPTRLFSDGFDYARGLRGPKDEDGAAALYVQAAEKGSGDAIDALGQMALQKGKPDAARKWFRQAAMHGSINGLFHYAGMLEGGEGGPADLVEARWLYVNAARGGHADAQDWLKRHGETPPLPRVAFILKDITETLAGASGTTTKPLDVNLKVLTDMYPTAAVNDRVEAYIEIHCYINSAHRIDVCIVPSEQPPGYGFGATISAFFNGDLSVPLTDKFGSPTAKSVAKFGFRFLL